MLTIAAADIRVGDLVDLEGDAFADPDRDNIFFQSELIEVVEVVRETDECVAIGLEGFDLVGFPPGHHLRVRRLEDEQ